MKKAYKGIITLCLTLLLGIMTSAVYASNDDREFHYRFNGSNRYTTRELKENSSSLYMHYSSGNVPFYIASA